MKVVIFCGGMGTRLKEETEFRPKPLVPIGGKPILWHIMKIYSHYGFRDFVLCLGYKGAQIKEYFLRHSWMENDFELDMRSRQLSYFSSNDGEHWRVVFADTGQDTQTGGRLARVRKYLEGEERFMATYGDGLADIAIPELADFHAQNGKIATISGAHPHSKYGLLEVHHDRSILNFTQKPKLSDYVNIGFMVFEKEIFDHLQPQENRSIEQVFGDLVAKRHIAMYPHEDFFHAMDTYQDYQHLNDMWARGERPWCLWET